MVKEFRDFILRGNIVELAVAVVIGVAFQALIDSIVTGLIQPVIAVFGGSNVNGLNFRIISDNAATLVDINAVIAAVISFLVTALVVFFLFVKPYNALSARFAPKPDAEQPAKPDDVVLLEQIRDLLREQRKQV